MTNFLFHTRLAWTCGPFHSACFANGCTMSCPVLSFLSCLVCVGLTLVCVSCVCVCLCCDRLFFDTNPLVIFECGPPRTTAFCNSFVYCCFSLIFVLFFISYPPGHMGITRHRQHQHSGLARGCKATSWWRRMLLCELNTLSGARTRAARASVGIYLANPLDCRCVRLCVRVCFSVFVFMCVCDRQRHTLWLSRHECECVHVQSARSLLPVASCSSIGMKPQKDEGTPW